MTAHALDLHKPEKKPLRDSFDINDKRAQVFRPIEHGIYFKEALLETLDEWGDWSKRKGKPHLLNQNCRKVLDALLRCCNFERGICEPSIDTLMKKTHFARATVVRALHLLWDKGFVNWIRRTAKTNNAPDEGPPVTQVSNAYFFDLSRMPPRCLKRLKEKLRRKGKTFTQPPQPSFPRYEGLQKRRTKKIRDQAAYDRAVKRNALARAKTPEQTAAALYPGDQKAQREYLAMLNGASSDSRHDSLPNRSIKKE